MKKNDQLNMKKILLAAVVLTAAGIGGTGLYQYQNSAIESAKKLEQIKEEKRQELKDAEGNYNETSIVLSDTTKVQAEAIAEKIGAEVRLTKNEDYAVLYLPENVSIEDIYDSEEYSEYLPEMEPDYYVYTCETEEDSKKLYTARPEYSVNDEYYDRQTYLDYVRIGDTWTATKGACVKIAVIDTGIDTDNPEFKGRISEDSYNATSDKKVKDYGMDVIEDEDGHGTGVSGVLAASMDQTGITGIAPEAELIVIKCESNGNGQFTRSSDLVFGLAYAIECDADIVNMSFGTEINIFSRYTKLAVDSDVICVASAGNSSSAMPTYPAADENVIGVGALESEGWELADYSNYGDNLDVLAPGTAYTTQKGGGYASANGTSISAPIVSGATALYLAENPNTEYTTIKALLEASSTDLGVLGEDWQHGFGALDIHALVREEKGTITYEMLTDEIENEKQIFVKGHTIQTMAEPERENLVLDGWFYDNQTTDECEYYTDIFTEDVTLYASWINEDDGTAWQYTTQANDTVEITAYTGKRRYLTVPKELEGKKVTSIGEGAFAENTRLRQVILPDSLTQISERAFFNCNGLREIEIPEKVEQIGSETFYGCTRLSQVSIVTNGDLKTIGEQAFAMSGITSVNLPVNLTELASNAFYASTNLKTVNVANGNKTFRVINDALYNIGGDTLLYYPAGKSGDYEVADKTISIGDYAFAYTKSQEVVFPETMETFGKSSFYSSSVSKVSIPANVTTFGGAMFSNSRLKEITFASELKAEKLADDMFSWCWNLRTVMIPKAICELGSNTFAVSGLREVSFADGSKISTIGGCAFRGCQIEEFHVPDGVTAIEQSTFYFCQNLKVLEFGKNSSCQMIGDYALADCPRLEKLELPSKMRNIRSRALWNSGLKEIVIGSGVESIEEGTFSHCQKLNTITVDSGNRNYTAEKGVLFNKEKTELLIYPAGKTGNYQIPDAVEKIRESAFAGASKLENIYFNKKITEIGGYAFSECTALCVPEFPSGLVTIGENAFEYCTSFNSELVIPKTVVGVGRFAFFMDYALNRIVIESDSSITRIGYGAFGYCGIEDFTIPENVSSMGQEVFTGCNRLIAVTFEADSQLENLAAWTFSGAEELRQITFEDGSNLKNIEARALEGLNRLQRITLENCKQLTEIGNYAFKNDSALSEIAFPENLTEIGRYAFNGCVSLTRLDMPEKLNRIGRYAFLKDKSLNVYFKASELPKNLEENWDYDILNYYLGISEVSRSGDWEYALGSDGMANIIAYHGTASDIVLDKLDGHKVASIGSSVFKDNATLSSIKLPATLTGIYQRAFAGTTALKNVTIPAAVKIIDAEVFRESGISDITFEKGSQLEVLGNYAFAQTINLKKMEVPDGVSKIRDYAFYRSGVDSVTFGSNSKLSEIGRYAFSRSNINSIKVPTGVKKLDHYAFADTEQLQQIELNGVSDLQIMGNVFHGSGLKNVDLPEGVSYLGEFCFTDCKNLNEISVAEGNSNYASSGGVLFNKAQTKLITCPAGKTGSYTVPDSVLSFMSGAFEGASLNEIHMSEDCKLQTLGYRTFYDCDSLEVIDIPDSILSIDNYAFAYCDNLQKVNISENSQLSGIYKGAFYKNEKLDTLVVPSGVLEIGDYAFYGCTAMESVQLSQNSDLKRVSEHAFEYAGVTAFTMPSDLDEIGEYAFNGAKLRNIVFNDVVTSIGDYAFANCGLVDMTVMTMPESIEYLGINALKGADTIEEITVPFVGTVEDAESCSFANLFGGKARNVRKVVVLKGKYLGVGAFFNEGGQLYDNLEEVVLPETLIEIGAQAFSSSQLIKTINIPDNVQIIGIDAFAYTYLEMVHLPKTLKKIEKGAFWGSYSLKNITLPDSLEEIGQDVFNQSEVLEKITVPKNVKYIGDAAFSGCKNLTEITVVPDNRYFCSVNGILYDKECTRMISAPGGYTGALKIPEGITEIPDYMFSHCEKITEIEFSKSVKHIGAIAFGDCNGLKSVVIPESIESVDNQIFWNCKGIEHAEIYAKLTDLRSMFYGCSNLKELYYPDTIENIGYMDWCGLENIKIGDSIKSIGSFNECSNLKSLYIGKQTKIENVNAAFEGCKNLVDITVSEENPYYKAVDNCLYTKDEKTLIVAGKNIKGTVRIKEGVERIRGGCFSYCKQIDKIIIPDSVVDIGPQAFSDCVNLKDITAGNNISEIGANVVINTPDYEKQSNWSEGILYIGTYAVMSNDDVVSECKIKEGTQLLADSLFANNDKIRKVILPDSTKYIENCVFMDCGNLKYVRFGKHVKKIGSAAFARDDLWSISISTNAEGFDEYSLQMKNARFVSLNSIPENMSLTLWGNANIECVNIPSKEYGIYQLQNSGNIRKYILTDSDKLSSQSFDGIYNTTIFINASENEDLPQGWNNGNKVYYKDQWHYAEFDSDGVIIQMSPTPNGEVLQVPSAGILEDLLPEGAEFAGWDINGDGLVDKLPVTLTEDIHAEAIYNVDIKSISLEDNVTVEEGYTKKLEVKYSPAHYTVEGGVTFNSSNESIVKVDKDGVLTGVKQGTATVTAVLNNKPSVTAKCEVDVVEPSYGVRFDPCAGSLNVGETMQLEADLKLPKEDADSSVSPTITWKSQDETIVVVKDGLITAVAPGNTTITATCGVYTGEFYLNVFAPLESISMNQTEGSLNLGETQQLKVNYLPENTTDDKTVTWFSTRSSIATVDDNGLVTAVKPGTVNIKASVGSKIATYKLTVKAPLKWIKLNTTTGTMRLNRTKQMEIIYEPSDTTDDKTAVWTSSDPQVASVDENGLVTTVSRGKSVITAKVGAFSASYDVTVIGLRDDKTGIIVTNSDDTEMAQDVALSVTEIGVDNQEQYEEIIKQISQGIGADKAEQYGFTAYDIALTQSGHNIQPTTTVDVDIPSEIQSDAVVYRVESDGSLTDMHVTVGEKGYYSFETEHFSTYVFGIKHNWSTIPLEEKDATCTENGWISYKCQDCDAIKKVEILAEGHKEVKDEAEAATCETTGKTEGSHCSVCGTVIKSQQTVPALGHDYSDWVIVKDATYTEEGIEECICNRNPSHKMTRSIPKQKIPLLNCKINLSDVVYVYDGTEKTPSITVTYDDTELTENIDYVLLYTDNIEPGMATVTVEAADGSAYTGMIQQNFEIRPALDENAVVVQPNAFEGCANLVNVNIKATVTEIGAQAFADCKNLRNVYFYGNCPKIGNEIFRNVKGTVYYPYNNTTWTLDKLQGYGGTITWCPWNPNSGKPAKRDMSLCKLTVTAKNLVYDGKAKTPKITVKDSGRTLQAGKDYTVSYTNNTKAGTGIVTVTGTGNYGGKISGKFAIGKAANRITVANINRNASTKAQTVSSRVRVLGGAKRTYSSNSKYVKIDKNGKLTIAANFAGRAVITVKAFETSCYKASSKKFTVTVKPMAVSITRAVNSAKNAIVISWKGNRTCSGYTIQYSTSKNFKSGVKTVSVNKNSTVKNTLSKLTKGKTYYIRIASLKKVGTTKLVSGWSKVKSVKIRK